MAQSARAAVASEHAKRDKPRAQHSQLIDLRSHGTLSRARPDGRRACPDGRRASCGSTGSGGRRARPDGRRARLDARRASRGRTGSGGARFGGRAQGNCRQPAVHPSSSSYLIARRVPPGQGGQVAALARRRAARVALDHVHGHAARTLLLRRLGPAPHLTRAGRLPRVPPVRRVGLRLIPRPWRRRLPP